MKHILAIVFFLGLFYWSKSVVLADCCTYGSCQGSCYLGQCYGGCAEPTAAPLPTSPPAQVPTPVPTLAPGGGGAPGTCGTDDVCAGESACLQDGSNAATCCLQDCGYAVDPLTQVECGGGTCGDGTSYKNLCSPSCDAANRTCFTNRTCTWGGSGCTSDAWCAANTVGAQCGNGAPAGCGVVRCNLPAANGTGGNCWSDCTACGAPNDCGATTCTGGGSCGAAMACKNSCGSWTEYDTNGCGGASIAKPTTLTSTEDCINDEVTLYWNKVLNATYYQMEILNWYTGRASYTCGDDTEDKCLADVGNLGFYKLTPTPGLYYRWRVRGMDRNGLVGTWSNYTDKQTSGPPICTAISGFSTFPWTSGKLPFTASASNNYVNTPKSVSTALWTTSCDGNGTGVSPAAYGAEDLDCRADLRWYTNTIAGAGDWLGEPVIDNHPTGYTSFNAHDWAFGCYSNDFCGSMVSNYAPKSCSVTAVKSAALVGGSEAYDITATGNANMDPGADGMRLFIAKKDGTRADYVPYYVPGVGPNVDLNEKNSCAGTGSWSECYGGATTANGYWIYQFGNDSSYTSTNAVDASATISNVVLPPGEYSFWCDFAASTADEQSGGVYKNGSMVTGNPWCLNINNEAQVSSYIPTVKGSKLSCSSPITWNDAGPNDYAIFTVNSIPVADASSLALGNDTTTLTANAGRNHSCEGTRIGSDASDRRVYFNWSSSDSDGATDIVRTSIRFTDGASVFYQVDATRNGASWDYSESGSQIAGAEILSAGTSALSAGNIVKQSVAIGFSGAVFTEGMYSMELQAEDLAGQITAWTGTSRTIKVWDCKFDVTGIIYDTGQADPVCQPNSSYVARGYPEYGRTDFRQAYYDVSGLGFTVPMTISGVSQYTSASILKFDWGKTYTPKLKINSTAATSVRVTQPTGAGQCLSQIYPLTNLDPYLDDVITVEHGVRASSEGWWQVVNGNINAGGAINNNIAGLCGSHEAGSGDCVASVSSSSAEILRDNFVSPGALTNMDYATHVNLSSRSRGVILGRSFNSTRTDRASGEWRSENTSHKVRDNKTFEYYKNTAFVQRGIGTTINLGVGQSKLFSEIVGTNRNNTGMYLIDGVLDIDVGNTVPAGGYLMVVASGGISIGTSVNDLQGMFIAASKQGSALKSDIIALDSPRDSDGFPLAAISLPLTIKGLVYADGDLKFMRTLNALPTPGSEPTAEGRAQNNALPAVKLIYDAAGAFSMPGSLNSSRTNWRSR